MEFIIALWQMATESNRNEVLQLADVGQQSKPMMRALTVGMRRFVSIEQLQFLLNSLLNDQNDDVRMKILKCSTQVRDLPKIVDALMSSNLSCVIHVIGEALHATIQSDNETVNAARLDAILRGTMRVIGVDENVGGWTRLFTRVKQKLGFSRNKFYQASEGIKTKLLEFTLKFFTRAEIDIVLNAMDTSPLPLEQIINVLEHVDNDDEGSKLLPKLSANEVKNLIGQLTCLEQFEAFTSMDSNAQIIFLSDMAMTRFNASNAAEALSRWHTLSEAANLILLKGTAIDNEMMNKRSLIASLFTISEQNFMATVDILKQQKTTITGVQLIEILEDTEIRPDLIGVDHFRSVFNRFAEVNIAFEAIKMDFNDVEKRMIAKILTTLPNDVRKKFIKGIKASFHIEKRLVYELCNSEEGRKIWHLWMKFRTQTDLLERIKSDDEQFTAFELLEQACKEFGERLVLYIAFGEELCKKSILSESIQIQYAYEVFNMLLHQLVALGTSQHRTLLEALKSPEICLADISKMISLSNDENGQQLDALKSGYSIKVWLILNNFIVYIF